MKKEKRDLHQITLDNPAVLLIEKVREWENELKAEGWDESHIKQILRNRIRRAERRG